MHISEWIPNPKIMEVGWIDLQLNMHVVKSFEHIEWLRYISELATEYEHYENTIENNAEWMNDELASLPDGEHPAMHRFDGMDDDAKDELYLAAYKLGYVRYGCFDAHTCRSHNQVMYSIDVTGFQEHLEKLTKYFKKLAKDLPMQLIYHPVVTKNKYGKSFISTYDLIIGDKI